MTTRKKYLIGLSAGAAALILIAGGTAFAAGKFQLHRPTVMGTVASISGNSITLTAKNSTTYTVDASKAKISKIIPATKGTKPTQSTISVSQIQVGDTLTVFGTASGNNVAATQISDGSFGPRDGGKPMMKPSAVGTVASVIGNTITLTGKNGTTYTVDASNASITKITAAANGIKPTSTTISISNIAVGDNLVVVGTLNGSNITATKIIDGTADWGKGMGMMQKPAALGKVASISGNSITLTGMNNTTYIVDATNAKITKYTAGGKGVKPTQTSITISQISVGDYLAVQGTASGDNITATQIFDGQFMGGGRGFGRGMMMHGKPAPAQ